jgi:hypothetical protein
MLSWNYIVFSWSAIILIETLPLLNDERNWTRDHGSAIADVTPQGRSSCERQTRVFEIRPKPMEVTLYDINNLNISFNFFALHEK